MRTSVPLVAVALLAVSWSAAANVGTDMEDCGLTPDAGDLYGSAHPIGVPLDCQGMLRGTQGDQVDVFAFEAPVGAMIDATRFQGRDVCVEPSGAGVSCASEEERNVWREVTTPGTHFLFVSGNVQDEDLPYRFTLKLGPDDCDSGADAADLAAGAQRLGIRTTCLADLTANDDADWWRVPVLAGQTLFVNQTRNVLDHTLDLCVVEPGTAATFCSVHTSGANRLQVQAQRSGAWNLFAEGPPSTRYGFDLAVTGGVAADCAGSDAGDVSTSATALARNVTCTGTVLGTADDPEDWFRIELPAGAEIDARATPRALAVGLCMTSPAGGTHCASEGAPIALTTEVEGVWLARVHAPEQVAEYTFRVAAIVPGDCNTPDDATASAPIPLSQVCEGVLPVGDTRDVYAVTTARGESIVATLTPEGEDAGLCWSADLESACSARSPSPTQVVTGPRQGETLLFHVRPAAAHPTFRYRLELARHASDDCGAGIDATPRPGHSMSGPCSGSFVPGDLIDTYRVDAAPGIEHSLHVSTERSMEMCVMDTGATERLACTGPFVGNASLPWTASAGVLVVSLFALDGPTRHVFDPRAISPPDCTGVEAGDTFSEATPFPLAPLERATCSGVLWRPAGDKEDWYRLDGPQGHPIVVSVAERLPQFELCGYAADGTFLTCGVYEPTTERTVLPLPPGVRPWRLRVHHGGWSAAYGFELRVV